MPTWVAIAGVVVSAIVAIGLFVLAGRRERDKERREAAATFRSAFLEALSEIARGNDPHAVLTRVATQHDAAISTYGYFVSPTDREAFDAAAVAFRQSREALQPAMLQWAQSQASGVPVQSTTTNITATINGLLAFATEP